LYHSGDLISKQGLGEIGPGTSGEPISSGEAATQVAQGMADTIPADIAGVQAAPKTTATDTGGQELGEIGPGTSTETPSAPITTVTDTAGQQMGEIGPGTSTETPFAPKTTATDTGGQQMGEIGTGTSTATPTAPKATVGSGGSSVDASELAGGNSFLCLLRKS